MAVLSASAAYGLLPFRAAGGLRCSAVLRGGEPEERTAGGYLAGQEERACANEADSRLVIAAVTTVVLLIVGAGAVLLPESQMERIFSGHEELPDYGR